MSTSVIILPLLNTLNTFIKEFLNVFIHFVHYCLEVYCKHFTNAHYECVFLTIFKWDQWNWINVQMNVHRCIYIPDTHYDQLRVNVHEYV